MKISMYSKTKNRGLVFVSMGSHEEALAAFTNLQSYVSMYGSLLDINISVFLFVLPFLIDFLE